MDTRENILAQFAHQELPTKPIHAFGQDLIVKTMTAAEKDAFDHDFTEAKKAGTRNLRALMVIYTLCLPDRSPVFTPDDLEAVSTMSYTVIEHIFDAAVELNDVGGEEVAEIAGNS